MRRILLTAALSVIAFGACDEASGPEGREGTLTVRAFIDSDASGTLTASDAPIPGLSVTLMRDGTAIATQSTLADGSVTFSDLPPGSYRIQATGTLPVGVMLVSNPEPTAAINFRGDPVNVGFLYTVIPATISGRVVRASDDAGAENVRVVLTRAGTTDTVATTTTSATGAYQFGRLTSGDYQLEFERAGAIDYGTAGNLRSVTLVAGESETMDVNYTGSIYVTVAEARADTVGARVAVIADVTVPAGRFTASSDTRSEIWVQDATGGIAVFSVATADSALYQVGQRVEVVGQRSVFSGQEQISGNTASPLVVRQRTGGVIHAAKTITAAVARTLADEGRLVRVTGLSVDSVFSASSAGAFNVRMISAANDTLTVRVHGDDTGLTRASFTDGASYDITGVLTQNNTTVQIKPRSPADVVLTPVTGGPAIIVINEFIANPDSVFDSSGEWIELHNAGGSSIDLQGWTIGDITNIPDTIDVSLVVPAGGYVVLGVNANPATNGGVQVDFVYNSRVSLNQSGDQIRLRNAAGVMVDTVTYPAGAALAGIAVGLTDPTAENSDASGPPWIAQTTNYNRRDKGTPRAPNDGYVAPAGAASPSSAVGVAPSLSRRAPAPVSPSSTAPVPHR